MTTAAKVLILGGLGSLLLAFVMGFVLSQVRMRDHTVPQPRLLGIHVGALWQGFMLLGLVWAVALSTLSPGVETLAAALLVGGAAFQHAANFVAWTKGVEDLFAPPQGTVYRLAAINAVLAFAGLSILVVGAVKAL